MSDALIRRLGTQLRATGQIEEFVLEMLNDPGCRWSDSFIKKLDERSEFHRVRRKHVWRGGALPIRYCDLTDERLIHILEAHRRGHLANGRVFGVSQTCLRKLTSELEFRGLELHEDKEPFF